MPNYFAYFMLLIWPIVTILLFKKLSVERAVIWSILGAYLILPPVVGFDFPLLPPFGKESIPAITVFVVCVFMLGQKISFGFKSVTGRILIFLFILSPIGTVLTNGDPIVFEQGGLPGLRFREIFGLVVDQFLLILPFFIARQFLASEKALRELLLAFVIAGLVYSIPMLIEVRLSPRINVWVYGFFQHNFGEMVRYGGFRPIVFLEHGIWVAFFAMMAVIAALALMRTNGEKNRPRFFFVAGYLGIVLMLCKTLGAFLYAIALAPLILFTSPGIQVRIALVLAVIALFYPFLRGAGFVPVEAMLEQAGRIDPERAGSLWARFTNEEMLLERARERPIFGWGSWGRNHLHNLIDGTILTVTDGRWIIVIGVYGWIGYIVEFGLLAMPIFTLLWASLKKDGVKLTPYASALALILAINMIELLPNATLMPLTWLIAGALLGYAEGWKGSEVSVEPKITTGREPRRYARGGANHVRLAAPKRLPTDS